MKEQKLPYGNAVIGFDSSDEMFAYMDEQERIAIAGALPEQWLIDWGSWAVRMVEDLAIFGEIWDQEQVLGPDPDEEAEEELRQIIDSHRRGYRYGKWYSEVEPEGEYGSAHVVSLWEISKDDFEVGRRNGWRIWPELAFRIRRDVTAARTRKESNDEGSR
jgi:hypothetical protein